MAKSAQQTMERPLSIDAESPSPTGAVTAAKPDDVARYVADMSVELAVMARASGLDMLAYLLDITSLEASAVARKHSEQRRVKRAS